MGGLQTFRCMIYAMGVVRRMLEGTIGFVVEAHRLGTECRA